MVEEYRMAAPAVAKVRVLDEKPDVFAENKCHGRRWRYGCIIAENARNGKRKPGFLASGYYFVPLFLGYLL